MKKILSHFLPLVLTLSLSLPVLASEPLVTTPSLAEALTPYGTLKAGIIGSFDARRFRVSLTPEGHPTFQPVGMGDERWDNSANGINGWVNTVAVAPNGDVYVGGSFTRAGGVPVSSLAKWNGSTWSSTGIILNGAVYALLFDPQAEGPLYVGGSFDAQFGSYNHVAKCDGRTWSSLGAGAANGVSGNVYALALASNGDLYVGGGFRFAGGRNVASLASNIAKWNGTSWSTVGEGLEAAVFALVNAGNGRIYAGTSGASTDPHVYQWDGTTWSGVGTGVNDTVFELVLASNGDLYAGGFFTQAGGAPASHVAKWNGSAWSPLGAGVGGNAYALAMATNGDLYVGGHFAVAGGVPANYVAKWNGNAWSPLGSGVNIDVSHLAIGAGDRLYAVGGFTTTGDGIKSLTYFGIYDPNLPLATTSSIIMKLEALFPNPAHNDVTLRLPARAPLLPLTLLDAQGRTVRHYPASTSSTTILDLSGLPAGLYLVQSGQFTQRLVVE